MKKYRYIHLMFPNDLKFLPSLIKIFNNPENGFNRDEHLFVTPHENVYNNISEKENTVFRPVKEKDYAKLINSCCKQCDWLIMHGMPCSISTFLKIKTRYFPKIIWRTWGGDAAAIDLLLCKPGEYVKNLVKRVIFMLRDKKISKLYGIGVGNNVDVMDIQQKFGKTKTFFMSYAGKSNYEELMQIRNSAKIQKNTFNIMLGHSGHKTDNHFEVIDKLCEYKNEQIVVYIPLSYGKAPYIQEVKEYAASKLGDKVIFIDSYMKYSEYASLLNSMDVAIFDGKDSYALGNIGILLFFRKKLFLNSNGILKKAFDADNIPYFCSDRIGEMSFEEFSAPATYPESEEDLSLQTHSYEYNINKWKTFFKELEETEVK